MKQKKTQLTETELELMSILWSLKSGTVREVLKHLAEGRSMAYTSASTIIRILEQKKIVESIKFGKAHVYKPLLTKAEYEKTTLNHVVEKVFNGVPSDLVKSLVQAGKLSEEEKNEIKRLINQELK